MISEATAYEGLNQIFKDVFLRDDIELRPSLMAKDVEGWDSFKQLEIIMACEESFNIKFKTSELDSLQSLGDLASLVIAKAK